MSIQKIRLAQVLPKDTTSYSDLDEQITNMSIPYYQEFIAVDNQTQFTLNKNYVVGNRSLKVFLNGIYQDLGIDKTYIEQDSQTVVFNEPLYAGDWVLFRIEGAGNGTTLQDHLHITKEVPFGNIDGVNRVFTLQYTPRIKTDMVFKNGVLMSEGSGEDYVIVGPNITFADPPLVGTKILVSYIV